MLGHLTENQIEDYGRQRLSAAELLSVSDHLGVCESCRGQVERALGGDAAFLALRSEVFDPPAGIASSTGVWTHPTVEQIAEYVDGMPTGEEMQVVKDHLTSCEQCALAVNDLRAFKNQVAPTLNREYHPESVRATSRKLEASFACAPAFSLAEISLGFQLGAGGAFAHGDWLAGLASSTGKRYEAGGGDRPLRHQPSLLHPRRR